jgi:actin-related protein
LPSIVGRPKHIQAAAGGQNKDSDIGNKTRSQLGILNLSYPIEHGIVTNDYELE